MIFSSLFILLPITYTALVWDFICWIFIGPKPEGDDFRQPFQSILLRPNLLPIEGLMKWGSEKRENP